LAWLLLEEKERQSDDAGRLTPSGLSGRKGGGRAVHEMMTVAVVALLPPRRGYKHKTRETPGGRARG